MSSTVCPVCLPAPFLLRQEQPAGLRGYTDADLRKTQRRSSYVACITVARESPTDVGFREIFVSVDGEQVAILRYGESFTCEVPAGPHRLRAHNTLFWKTHEVVLQPGEHARFIAINRAGWGTFGLLLMLGAAPVYLTFERDDPSAPPSPEPDTRAERRGKPSKGLRP